MALSIALPRLSQTELPDRDHDEAIFRADSEGYAHTSSLHLYESFEAAEQIWRALEAEGTGSVYQRYDWCKIWFETFHPKDDRNGSASPLIVVATVNNRPAFLLPLYSQGVFLGIKRALFMGDKHANVRVPLMSKDPVLQAALLEQAQGGNLIKIIGSALKGGGHADHLALENMPKDYAGDLNPLTFGDCKAGMTPLFVGELNEDFQVLTAERRPLSSQRKQRKRVRMLKAIGEISFDTIDDASALDDTLNVLFQQKAVRLDNAQIHNAFDDANNEAFIRRLAHQSLASGNRLLDLYALTVNGETIAVTGGGMQGDRYSIGINSMSNEPRYAACSPGKITVDMEVEAFCAEGFHWFDIGLGENSYKRMWCAQIDLFDVCRALTPKGQLLVGLSRSISELKTLVKSTPWAKKLAQRVNFHAKRLIK